MTVLEPVTSRGGRRTRWAADDKGAAEGPGPGWERAFRAGPGPTDKGFAVAGIQVSSVMLTCMRWYPSQPGVMNRLSSDPTGPG